MPEPTFLQIQGGGDPSTRMIELHAGPVRVGRGSHCEVRLAGDLLGEVQCLLRRRGDSWHFQPVGPSGQTWIEGRPADHQRPLPFGIPFRVGDHWLTLRTAENATNDWGSFAAPITVEPRVVEAPTPPEAAPPEPEPTPAPPPEPDRPRSAPAAGASDDRLRRWQSRLDQRERWLQDRQDEKRWEARWKAASETLRARGTQPAPAPAPKTSTPPPTPRPPEARTVEPRPAEPYRRPAAAERRPIAPGAHARPAPRPALPAPPSARPPAPLVRPEPARPAVPRNLAALPGPTAPPTTPPAPAPADLDDDAVSLGPPVGSEPSLLVVEVAESAPIEARTPEVAPADFDESIYAIEPDEDVIVEVGPAPDGPSPLGATGDGGSIEAAYLPEPIPIRPDPGPDPTGEIGSPPGPAAPAIEQEEEDAGPTDPGGFAAEVPVSSPEVDPIAGREGTDPGSAGVGLRAPVPATRPPLEARAEPVARPATPPGPGPGIEPRPAGKETKGPRRPGPKLRDVGTGPAPSAAEWPSARAIFAAQGRRDEPSNSAWASKRRAAGPEPTEARAPGQWTLPLWVGWFPAFAMTMALGAGGVALSVAWAVDANSGNLALGLALRPESARGATIDLSALPRGGWWRSTAGHLAAWAVAVERSGDGLDHGDEVRGLLEDAQDASRLAAGARFAVETPAAAGVRPLTHLGRTRDAVSMAWTGRALRAEGKADAALRAYRSAFGLAAGAARGDLDPPSFDDDPQVRRYALPRAVLLGGVAREMAEAGPWAAEQWAEALPRFAPAYLAAARALARARAKDRDAADRLLGLAIALGDAPAPGLDEAEHRAAVAEALALRARWTPAAEHYEAAIAREGDEPTRRMWSINLAEVYFRAGDKAARARALEAAKAVDSADEVTRRALNSQHAPGGLGLPTRGR